MDLKNVETLCALIFFAPLREKKIQKKIVQIRSLDFTQRRKGNQGAKSRYIFLNCMPLFLCAFV